MFDSKIPDNFKLKIPSFKSIFKNNKLTDIRYSKSTLLKPDSSSQRVSMKNRISFLSPVRVSQDQTNDSRRSVEDNQEFINSVSKRFQFKIDISESDEKLKKYIECSSPRNLSKNIVYMTSEQYGVQEASMKQKFFESTHRIDNSECYAHQTSIMNIQKQADIDSDQLVISQTILKPAWKTRYILPDSIKIGPEIKKYQKKIDALENYSKLFQVNRRCSANFKKLHPSGSVLKVIP